MRDFWRGGGRGGDAEGVSVGRGGDERRASGERTGKAKSDDQGNKRGINADTNRKPDSL